MFKNTFTKNLKGLRHKPYKERLAKLNLLTLDCSRSFNDLVFLYKFVHDLSDNKLQSLFSPADRLNTTILRRRPYQLYLLKPRFDLFKFSFRYRVIKLWNSLPEHIILCNASSVTIFKQFTLPYSCKLVYNA